MRSDYGTQHVVTHVSSTGEAVLPTAPKRRTTKAKMPLAEAAHVRQDAASDAVLRETTRQLLLGTFNTLMATVVKDLQGYAFGSTAGNAGKVIAQERCATRPHPNPNRTPTLTVTLTLTLTLTPTFTLTLTLTLTRWPATSPSCGRCRRCASGATRGYAASRAS